MWEHFQEFSVTPFSFSFFESFLPGWHYFCILILLFAANLAFRIIDNMLLKLSLIHSSQDYDEYTTSELSQSASCLYSNLNSFPHNTEATGHGIVLKLIKCSLQSTKISCFDVE
jgi:hypothetical protein